MLEFDDIQHILLTRAPALTGRYEFLSFRSPGGGRAWLAGIRDKVHSAEAMRASVDSDKRWVTVAFTWNGLRALGVRRTLAGLVSRGVPAGHGRPARRCSAMPARITPTIGSAVWPALTCMPLSSSSPAMPPNASAAGPSMRSSSHAAKAWNVLSSLDLEATPPFDYAHDHFGYRDRLSQPAIEGSGEEPTPGSGQAAEGRANSYSATRTKTAPRFSSRSRRSFRATAVSWPIAVWRNMSARFAIF